jgi:hypothetical protein
MQQVENKHWRPKTANPLALSWASYLVLSPQIGKPLSDTQQEQYAAWLTTPNYDNLKLLKIRFDPELFHWGLSFVLDAHTPKQAVQDTATAAIEGLGAAGIAIESLVHIENHLESMEGLLHDVRQANQAGQPAAGITHHRYDFPDSRFAHDVFLAARSEASQLDALLN